MPDLALIRPRLFDELSGYVAAFTTRRGGVSPAPFDTLNLGLNTADAPERVWENRRRVAEALAMPLSCWVTAGQVHGNRVALVRQPGHVPGVDALVTDRPGLLLGVTVADCAAVLLADPEAGVIGAAHAGWRGAASGVLFETLRLMQELGARAERIRAYISPAIGACHFEVGAEVAARFPESVVLPGPNGRAHVDLKRFLGDALLAFGLDPEHLEVSSACTLDDPERFFSHRGAQGRTGRMMGLIGRSA
ncbi:MAG: peptidoglycan editing factor PgeF [Bacteroidetes bacterium]|nr:peptidoglycan editing factor PgeF [Rhodothermia bacterium]MCS7154191.1 peptidoglycan editing factor PgeF [Bacteroidota bacterium]MCX7906773.1 peptidoglycan editing factor PgeF [Bacteroidota bacterium]MDW8136947.1 peptidoglycan editing factor PgeF [Bacteroidota bacterium]MDW8285182.1 peptidoglycan editing factor PgeF [Bacteroidota bacterium]